MSRYIEYVKQTVDEWGREGRAVDKIAWHTVHNDEYISADDEVDQYAADHYADAEGRARFHEHYDPYAKSGLQDSEDCRHDIELWYVGLWHSSDCITVDKAVEAFRDEAAKHGIPLPSTEDGIQTLAKRYINW